MGVAFNTMATLAHRFCRPILGIYALTSHWRTFKMARSYANFNDHHKQNSRNPKKSICSFRCSGANPQWQWCDSDKALHIGSLSPLYERPCWTLCPKFQERHTLYKKRKGNPKQKLENFLVSYRNTIHPTTGKIPAKLLMERNLRARFDLLKPDIREQAQQKQLDQSKERCNRHVRDLEVG